MIVKTKERAASPPAADAVRRNGHSPGARAPAAANGAAASSSQDGSSQNGRPRVARPLAPSVRTPRLLLRRPLRRWAEEGFRRLLFLPPPLPRRIQIETTNRCNLACGMCPRDAYARPELDLSLAEFEAILDRVPLAPHAEIIPFGWGEPLLHEDLWEIVRKAGERGFTTTLFTNGLLWGPEAIESALASGLTRVFFSLEQTDFHAPVFFGHPNPGAIRNLRSLLQARNGKGPLVGIVGTVQAGTTGHALDLVRLGHDLGVDVVSLGRLFREINGRLPELPRESELDLMRGLRELRKTHPMQVDVFFSRRSSGWKRVAFTATRRLLHRANTRCPRTFDYVYVTRTGDVTPCCLHPNLALGNLHEQTLGEIWRGERFRAFRRDFRSHCGSCDIFRPSPARRSPARA